MEDIVQCDGYPIFRDGLATVPARMHGHQALKGIFGEWLACWEGTETGWMIAGTAEEGGYGMWSLIRGEP